MKRVPLWGAILILVLLIIVAIGGNTSEYTIDQGKIWTIIAINAIFIVIGIVRAYTNR
jgi:hypothetical protein